MTKPIIDTRGLSCPQPVVLVLQALKGMTGSFDILVDSGAARENIRRTLEKKQIGFDAKEENGDTVYSVKR